MIEYIYTHCYIDQNNQWYPSIATDASYHYWHGYKVRQKCWPVFPHIPNKYKKIDFVAKGFSAINGSTPLFTT